MLALPDGQLPHTVTTSLGENDQALPDGSAQQVCNQFCALGAMGGSPCSLRVEIAGHVTRESPTTARTAPSPTRGCICEGSVANEACLNSTAAPIWADMFEQVNAALIVQNKETMGPINSWQYVERYYYWRIRRV
jgi:hypothetical protein